MTRRGRISSLIGIVSAAGALAMAAPVYAQSYSPGYLFLKAIEKGDANEVAELLQKHTNTLVDSRDITTGESALHMTINNMAKKGADTTWLRYLIQHKANVNVRDNKSITPLMLASQAGLVDAVDALVRAGARVDIPDTTGETPLIAAVHRRDVPVMRSLLIGGADPDRADSSGRTAREYARLAGGSLMAEIDKNSKPKNQREGAKVYGPSF